MEAIGTTLARVAQETASPAPFVERPQSLVPTTWQECRAISTWAEATMPVSVPASAVRVLKRLEYLEAMLPRKAQDDGGGELRATGYVSILLGKSDDALAYMVREACRTLNWFPTAKQCLDILGTYRAPESEQATALLACKRFASETLATWLENVERGQPLGDVPDQWLRIAVEQGLVRRLDDGSHVSRSRFVGPTMAGKFNMRSVISPVDAMEERL